MKRILGLFIVLGTISYSAAAQQRELKGPAYKNAHPAQKYAGTDVLLVKKNGAEQLKGPRAKNTAYWETERSDFTQVELDQLDGKNTKGLTGPAYKNYRPKGKPRTNN